MMSATVEFSKCNLCMMSVVLMQFGGWAGGDVV